MKKRYTEEQIIGFLKQADAGLAVKELCRRHGFSEASYYLWRSKFGGDVGTTVLAATPSELDAIASKAYEAEDYTTAFTNWSDAATQGDAEGQYKLGELYKMGEGGAVWNAPSSVYVRPNATCYFGYITYEDIFGQSHTTRYCFQVTGGLRPYVPGAYNQFDMGGQRAYRAGGDAYNGHD